MTAQISNIFKIDDREYEVLGLNSDLNFDPRDYGLKPVAPHTAAWKGYYYEASVKDGLLIVQNLHVNDYDGNYPDINGVSAVDEKDRSSFFTYYDLNIPLDYTGKILVGAGFIRRFYVHMGYQRPHAFDELVMISFRNGKLIESEDLSERARLVRNKIDRSPEEYEREEKSDLQEYIEESFSLNIDEEYL